MSEKKKFSLKKKQSFSLKKLIPGIKDFYIGLDWDPAIAGKDIDLDAVLIATDVNNKVLDSVDIEGFLYYLNHGRDGNSPSAFTITEDNRDGVDVGNLDDDEAIYVEDSKVDLKYKNLHVFVTFHEANGRSLSDVARIGLRIAPLINGKPDFNNQVVYDVREVGNSEGAHMCTLSRNPSNGWNIMAIGEPVGNLGEIAAQYGIDAE